MASALVVPNLTLRRKDAKIFNIRIKLSGLATLREMRVQAGREKSGPAD